MSRSIVVTGLGAISALGHDVQQNWSAALEGRCGIKPVLYEPGPHAVGAPVIPSAKVGGDPQKALEEALGHRVGVLDPFALFGLKAAHEALSSAGLIGHASLERRTAVVMGHGMSGLQTLESAYERAYGMKVVRVHPLTIPRVMVSAPVSAIAMEFTIKGPVFAVSSACASSGHAMIQGAGLIATGQADVALVGGSEAICTPIAIRAWEGLQAMTTTQCRPFSKDRDGMALGDGGAALVLESREHAEARGATILAELTGMAMSSDAFHWTQPTLEGALSSMRPACEQAGVVEASQLLIATHGTGTPLNDKNEAEAIHALFGPRAKQHPIIATKSAHGHLIGASTALQGVLAILALRERLAPPILNFSEPDPECDLDLVVGGARAIEAEAMLLNAFAFGGLNTSLVFKREG